MKRTSGAILAVMCGALLACTAEVPPTAIRVIIDSDLKIGAELSKLEVRVFDEDGNDELRRQDFALTQTEAPAQFTLPLSLRLASERQRSSRDFLLVVTGIGPLGDGGSEIEVVERQALASFRPGETLRLDMFLAKSCLLELCRRDGKRSALSCDVDTGSCQEVPRREQLPVATGDGIEEYEATKMDSRAQPVMDAGPAPAGDAAQAVTDGGPAASEDDDAAPADAETGIPAPVVASVGSACAMKDAKACAGHNDATAVVCSQGKWVVLTACGENQRCDTREGATLGTCLDVPLICRDRQPGKPGCDGALHVTCGDDLLDYTTTSCGDNQHCVEQPARCICNDGYENDGSAGCRNVDECTPSSCQHGGRCKDGIARYTCDCTGTGYRGDNCELDIDECAMAGGGCSSEYPCMNLEGGYFCRGEFASWPMPDSSLPPRGGAPYSIGADVVMDNVTLLMWQRSVPTSYPACTATGQAAVTCLWENAKAYCSNLSLGGFDDWRLPSLVELTSLIDLTRYDPAISAEAFPGTPSASFWTSTIDDGYVFGTNFQTGATSFGVPESSGMYIRCARGGAIPVAKSQHYVAVSDTVVNDTWTGLTWNLSRLSESLEWEQSVASCSSLGQGYRLPTAKEFVTLFDPAKGMSVPALLEIRELAFWSITTPASGFQNAVPVQAGNRWIWSAVGGLGTNGRLAAQPVACVKIEM